jgi:hypothetical protein
MNVQPGDILVTRSPGIFGRAIRLGAALLDRPNMDNHVAIVHHTDKHGTTWCLEGRPGGVGWRDARDYLRSPWTVNNAGQGKSAASRNNVCDGAVALIGTAYDWDAIADDAMVSLGMPLKDAWNPNGFEPGHVVCSSLAAYLYEKSGLTHPAGDRLVTPADWLQLIIKHPGWNR